MRYRLVDVINEVEENVQFGTCDLCFSFGSHHYDVVVVEDENDNEFKEEMGFWDYGDYIDFGIDNYVDFSAWLSKKNILGKFYIETLVEMYEDEVCRSKTEGVYGVYKDEILDFA